MCTVTVSSTIATLQPRGAAWPGTSTASSLLFERHAMSPDSRPSTAATDSSLTDAYTAGRWRVRA